MAAIIKCFLCGERDEEVTEFDDESFSKCSKMLAFRRHKNHAHGEIELSSDSRNEIGRHPQCYKKVTVLKSKYRDDYDEFCKKWQVNIFF